MEPMEPGTTKPGKALTALWSKMSETASQESRRQYEALNDQCREWINLWAELDPQQQDEVRQLLKA